MRQRAQVAARVDERPRGRRAVVAGVDAREARQSRRGTRRRRLRSPRARSSRSRRPGGRPARRTPRRAPACGAGPRRAAARSSSRRRQRMSGSRRSVPSPEHGASTSTQSKRPRRRAAAASRSACTMRTLVAPLAATVRRSSSMRDRGRRRRRAAAVRPSRPRSPWSCRPATRRCRGRDRPACAPASSVTSCDASSWTTNKPWSSTPGAWRSGWPSSTTSASGAKRPGATAMSCRREALRQRLAASICSRFARSVSGAGVLLNCIHASAASNPKRSSQRADQPARMRQRDR